jgi:hypothetical protein
MLIVIVIHSAYKRRNGPPREALSRDEAAPASEGQILQDPLGFSPSVASANQTPPNVSQVASQLIFTPEQAEYLYVISISSEYL